MKRGFTITETLVALCLLSVALVGLSQGIALSVRQRQRLQQQLVITQTAANLAERISVLPWDELTTAHFANLPPAPELEAVAPEAKVDVRVQLDDSTPASKRIHIAIRVPSRNAIAPAPTELVLWRFENRREP